MPFPCLMLARFAHQGWQRRDFKTAEMLRVIPEIHLAARPFTAFEVSTRVPASQDRDCGFNRRRQSTAPLNRLFPRIAYFLPPPPLQQLKAEPCIGFTVSHTPTQVHTHSPHTHTHTNTWEPQSANGRAGWYTRPGFHGNRATESPSVCRRSGMERRRRGCLDGFVFVCVREWVSVSVCVWAQPTCLCSVLVLCTEFNKNTLRPQVCKDRVCLLLLLVCKPGNMSAAVPGETRLFFSSNYEFWAVLLNILHH